METPERHVISKRRRNILYYVLNANESQVISGYITIIRIQPAYTPLSSNAQETRFSKERKSIARDSVLSFALTYVQAARDITNNKRFHLTIKRHVT